MARYSELQEIMIEMGVEPLSDEWDRMLVEYIDAHMQVGYTELLQDHVEQSLDPDKLEAILRQWGYEYKDEAEEEASE